MATAVRPADSVFRQPAPVTKLLLAKRAPCTHAAVSHVPKLALYTGVAAMGQSDSVVRQPAPVIKLLAIKGPPCTPAAVTLITKLAL